MTSTEPLDSTENEPKEVEHELRFDRVPKEAHEWRQQGMRIRCIGCGIDHGFFAPVGKRLVGTLDGIPQFE